MKKNLEDFDLTNKHERYQARKAGFDVPLKRRGTQATYFNSLVDKSGVCWEWQGMKDRCGYGRVNVEGKEKKAHRVMYEKTHGEIAIGVILMHTCDNPGCVNPEHLVPGTHQLNQADKVAKNRQARGEKNAGAKLTEEQVAEIRRLHKNARIKQVDLAARFSVCRDTIRKIVSREYWRHCA